MCISIQSQSYAKPGVTFFSSKERLKGCYAKCPQRKEFLNKNVGFITVSSFVNNEIIYFILICLTMGRHKYMYM